MRGRIRSIKPEIFDDEDLWDLAQETGLPVLQAFVGLWCYADREGRFEWRPRALKSKILPYWDGDMRLALEALASRSFIIRYTVNGKNYGYVRTFKEHQQINNKEPASTLPPPELHATASRDPRDDNANPDTDDPPSSLPEGNGKGREGNGKGTGRGKVASATRDQPSPEPTAPVDAQGVPVMHHTLDGWDEPPELEDDALMAGVPREFYRDRLKKLRNTKIGGRHGVRDRTEYVRDLFPQWRTWAEQERAAQAGNKHARAGPEDRLQRQADRVQMLREQEAEEERRAAAGGVSS